MTDTRKLLERQAAWQKKRVALTWAEKVRMAEAVREDVAKLRNSRGPVTAGDLKSGEQIGAKGRAGRKKKGK